MRNCKKCKYENSDECIECSHFNYDHSCSCHIHPPCSYCVNSKFEEYTPKSKYQLLNEMCNTILQ